MPPLPRITMDDRWGGGTSLRVLPFRTWGIESPLFKKHLDKLVDTSVVPAHLVGNDCTSKGYWGFLLIFLMSSPRG